MKNIISGLANHLPFFLQGPSRHLFFKFFFFVFFFFNVTILIVFMEFVTVVLLFYVLVFELQGLWDSRSLTRDRT